MSILLYIEHDGITINESTLRAASAANEISLFNKEDIHAIVIGSNCYSIAMDATKIKGISKVIYINNDIYLHPIAENLTYIINKIMINYNTLIAASTTVSKNFFPCVAALQDVMQISDIIKVNAANIFSRFIYAGNAIQTLETFDSKLIITVRTTAFKVVELNGKGKIITNTFIVNAVDSLFVKSNLSSSKRPELTSAKIVISGGRGMGSSKNFILINKIADKLNAAVGASRAAVDAGYITNDCQVGQTGKIVAPDLYIAVGISGAIQHLAGMKDSRIIVAINKDENAPIFQVADFGVIDDLFDVLEDLESFI